MACIRREGQDVEKIISSNDILNDNKVGEISNLTDLQNELSIRQYS